MKCVGWGDDSLSKNASSTRMGACIKIPRFQLKSRVWLHMAALRTKPDGFSHPPASQISLNFGLPVLWGSLSQAVRWRRMEKHSWIPTLVSTCVLMSAQLTCPCAYRKHTYTPHTHKHTHIQMSTNIHTQIKHILYAFKRKYIFIFLSMILIKDFRCNSNFLQRFACFFQFEVGVDILLLVYTCWDNCSKFV